jgi:Rrf2 family protein
MKISAKGMYAIGSLIFISKNQNKNTSIVNISKNLGISKIYLEQVFSLLKKNNLVISSKGPYGGYKLNKPLYNINLFDVLSITETNMFDNNENIFIKKYPQIDRKITKTLSTIDEIIKDKLKNISLEQIYLNIKANDEDNIYYI